MSVLEIHLITGGTGRTGEHVLRACLAQFSDPDVRLFRHIEVRSTAQVDEIIARAKRTRSIVCHTLVDPAIRQWVTESTLHEQVPSVDLLGPTLSVLGDFIAEEARGEPGLMYELHREQFDRMDAVDFTMAHDDGNRLRSLERAQIVVTGLSRMSKSVTCFYLASRGVRAANVPLIEGHEPPEELLCLPPDKVFGLTMNASHLASIRKARLNRISDRHVPNYATVRALNREIHFAEKLMENQGWHRIDVSYMATEEVASRIMDTLAKASCEPSM